MMKRLTAHQNTPAPSLELEITTAKPAGTGGHRSSVRSLPGQLPALNAAFQRMVAKKPEDRFQSMAEVIVALEQCRSGLAATIDFPGKSDSSGPALQSFLKEIQASGSTSARTAETNSRPTAVLSSASVESQEATIVDSQASGHAAVQTQLTITESAGKPLGSEGNHNRRRRLWLTATIVGVLLLVSLAVFLTNNQGTPNDLKTEAVNKGSDHAVKDEAEKDVAVKADAAGAPPDVDRAVAEWARSLGCPIAVEFSPEGGGQPIAVDAELPAAPFRLTAITFFGPKAERLGDQLIDRLDAVPLKVLRFLEVPITNAGVERLSSFANLSELSKLSLRGARIDDACVKHIAKFPALDWVSLEGAPITDACFSQFKNLTLLNLARTRITDDGLRHLKDYPRLIVLNLSQTAISDAGLKHLTGLSRLQEIVIDRTKVTIEGIQELRIALPKCNVATELGQ